MTEKRIKITDFLTDAQMRECLKYERGREIAEHVIAPNITEINRKLGQENNPLYLGYLVEYVLNQARK